MARSRILDLQKELHPNRLPCLVNCLPAVSHGKPEVPFGLPSYTKFVEPTQNARPNYRGGVNKPKGVHSFFNVMWDPHIVRGPGFKSFQEDAKEQCESIKKAKSQTKRKKFKLQQRKVGGICPWPPEIKQTEDEPLLAVDVFEKFLVESILEIKLRNTETQTQVSGCSPPEACRNTSFHEGIDVSTQVEDDLFDWEETAGLIGQVLVEKIAAQAIVEVMEEEEISALTKFKNELDERVMDRALRLVHIREGEQLELLEARKMEEEALMEVERERELEWLVGQNCFSRSAVQTIKERLLPELEKMGYPIDCVQLNIERRFIPWLNHKVLGEVEHRGISYEVLNDIVTAAALKRETDIFDPLIERLQLDYFHAGSWKDDDDTESILRLESLLELEIFENQSSILLL